MWIDAAIGKMQELGVATGAELVGVPAREILALEQQWSLRLPRAYRDFLLRCGRSAGYLSPWTALYFDDLKEIRDAYACQWCQRASPATPALPSPDTALFIAYDHLTFDYLVPDRSADPEVWRVRFGETPPTVTLVASSFSRYLTAQIEASGAQVPSQRDFEATIDAAFDYLARC